VAACEHRMGGTCPTSRCCIAHRCQGGEDRRVPKEMRRNMARVSSQPLAERAFRASARYVDLCVPHPVQPRDLAGAPLEYLERSPNLSQVDLLSRDQPRPNDALQPTCGARLRRGGELRLRRMRLNFGVRPLFLSALSQRSRCTYILRAAILEERTCRRS
jgi:hypothetical protein